MTTAKIAALSVERPQDAAAPCLSDAPYRFLAFARLSGQQRPLYFVAGVAGGPWSAERALRQAGETHGAACFYCGAAVAKAELTIDHVEPIVRGEVIGLQNLVLAHKACNAAKGHQPIEAFHPEAGRAWLEALHRQVEARLNNLK